MTQYVAKPYLFNDKDKKTFDNPYDAVYYLNQQLSDKVVEDRFDYVFIAPSINKRNLKKAIDEYTGIGKLQIIE